MPAGQSKTRKGDIRMRPMSKNSKIINPNREVPKGATHLRDKATINRLQMYKQKAVHDRNGKFLTGPFMSREVDERIKRVQPDRRWFGNTRVVGQRDLESFRDEMEKHVNDPYTVVMRNSKLPMGLLSDAYKDSKMNLLSTESFKDTFGKKSQRKKPRLNAQFSSMEAMVAGVSEKNESYKLDDDKNLKVKDKKDVGQGLFERGTSKRLWQELYKVIDSADVLVQVLDVRDPMGTRCKRIEDELKTRDRRHKHLVFVLNKCDLVPTWVTARWVRILSKDYPTLAMHASITNPYGKGSLIQLLRQFATLHADKKQISVGFVGYPNVGKSSVINTLKKKKVCTTAPIPGETRCWKYITLFKRVYLIDCPGVVYPNDDSHEEVVLKGVIRIDCLENPEDFVGAVLERVKKQYIFNAYGILTWKDTTDFLEKFCKKTGKLHKGGEYDFHNGARMILQDWQRGRLPYFVAPPYDANDKYNALKSDGQPVTIDQIFSKIAVKSKFTAEDAADPNPEETKAAEEAVKAAKAAAKSNKAAGGAELNEDMEDDDEEDDEEVKEPTPTPEVEPVKGKKLNKKRKKSTKKKAPKSGAELEEANRKRVEASTVVDSEPAYSASKKKKSAKRRKTLKTKTPKAE